MMLTNLITNPKATVTLQANKWASLTTTKKTAGTTYWVSFWVDVSGGSIRMNGTTIDSSRRFSYTLTATETSPMNATYTVVSGSPTVKVHNIICCTLAEYQANKTLIDQLYWFDGDTMPLA